MKLNYIEIAGINNIIAPKRYNLKYFNYFYGPNGSGKSTILQSIQLALLGYVPGESKNNKDIFLHANQKTMSVELSLDDNGNEITINRTWTKSGQSVTSKLDITGTEKTIESIVQEIVLPVYDFNEFMNMSANKMKEWFLNFLPSETKTVDWKKELKNSVKIAELPHRPKLENDLLQFINLQQTAGVDQIVEVNNYIKELISVSKGKITSIENTLRTLVRYDDSEYVDEEELRNELYRLQSLKQQSDNAKAAVTANTNIRNQIEYYADKCQYASAEEDAKMVAFKDKLAQSNDSLNEISKTVQMHKAELATLITNRQSLTTNYTQQRTTFDLQKEVTCPNCGYKLSKKTISKADLTKLQKEIEDNDKAIKAKEVELALQHAQSNELISDINQTNAAIRQLANDYEQLNRLKSAIVPVDPSINITINYDETIKELNDKLVNVISNKKNEALSLKLVNDKGEIENDLEVLKVWQKLTSVNGLQTTCVTQSPFIKLVDNMGDIIQMIFNSNTKAKFIEDAKANSFDFGIEQNDVYRSYMTLSSGEKCAYVLALAISLIKLSKSELKLILMDDMFDHLDDTNRAFLLNKLSTLSGDIQFILAGVVDVEGVPKVKLSK